MELGFRKDFDLDQEAKAMEQIIFLVVLLLIMIVIFRLLWVPVYEKIKGENEEIVGVKKQIEALEKFISLDKKITSPEPKGGVGKMVKFIEDSLTLTSKKPQQTMAEAMREITSGRNLGNLILNNISFEPIEVRGGYSVVPINLSVRGTYSALQNYFYHMEKLKYLYTVDNIRFKVDEKHPGIIIADLNTSLYIGASGQLAATPAKKPGDKPEGKK